MMSSMKKIGNRRAGTMALVILSVVLLTAIAILGGIWKNDALISDFSKKNLSPGVKYLFGTDFLGRDMLKRTMAGLSMSICLGVITSMISAVIALILGTVSAVFGKTADGIISGIIDLVMGIPHILLLILISFSCGKGWIGV
ncbi:MAG: ABC transporter permease, partial [Clostridium sp.]